MIHPWLFQLVMVWHALLIMMLLLYAMTTPRVIDRLVGFDALSIVFVAALSIVAIERRDPFYFDIALIVAMFGFVQTVAAARLLERRSTLQ
ncbi:MAG: monovalent cation/H+ antiporter complex subunit F [Alphaproteobacteria bacterium]